MTGRSVVVGVTTLSILSILQGSLVGRAPCLLAIVLVVVLAGCALSARVALSSDADQVANLVARVVSGTHNPSDDFVTDDGRVLTRTPAGPQDVNVATADTACRDLDIDIVLLERSRGVRVLLQRKIVALGFEGSVSSELLRDGSIGRHVGPVRKRMCKFAAAR